MLKHKRAFKKVSSAQEKKRQEVVDLTDKLNSASQELNDISTKKRNIGIQYYDEATRNSLISNAKDNGHSPSDINKLENFTTDEHWNQDEVDCEIIELFSKIEQFNYKGKSRCRGGHYNKNLFFRILDFFSDLIDPEESDDLKNDN